MMVNLFYQFFLKLNIKIFFKMNQIQFMITFKLIKNLMRDCATAYTTKPTKITSNII